MTTPDLRSWLPATGTLEFSKVGRALRRPPGLHSLMNISRQTWMSVAAAACGMLLLLGFQQVVSQSVVQIEQRRAAAAVQDDTVWRCKQLPSSAERKRCLASVVASAQ